MKVRCEREARVEAKFGSSKEKAAVKNHREREARAEEKFGCLRVLTPQTIRAGRPQLKNF